jgi:Protoglobin
MHTGQPSFASRVSRPKLKVEHIHMGLLLAYLMNILIDEVSVLPIGETRKRTLLKALNKVIWVQNDFFGRHYISTTAKQGDERSEPSTAYADMDEKSGCAFIITKFVGDGDDSE